MKIVCCKRCDEQFELVETKYSRNLTEINCFSCWKKPLASNQLAKYTDASAQFAGQAASFMKDLYDDEIIEVYTAKKKEKLGDKKDAIWYVGEQLFIRTIHGVRMCEVQAVDLYSREHYYTLKSLTSPVFLVTFVREEEIFDTYEMASKTEEIVTLD